MGLSALERQRAYRQHLRKKIAALTPIQCECGCGTPIPPINTRGKPARFAHGHNPVPHPKGRAAWNKGQRFPGTGANRGKKLSCEEITRRSATRLARNGGIYQIARGWHHSPDTLERMREASRLNAHYGSANHAWEGGKSFEPYDASFNRELKRSILKRDDYTCQDCGYVVGRRKGARRANVHHIDFDKLRTDQSNLVALCVPCHARRHWNARKLGTATD